MPSPHTIIFHPPGARPSAAAGPSVGRVTGILAALLLAAGVPATASAQFATGLTPPPAAPPPETVAAAESSLVAKRDSVVREQRLDMKAWVDSAARSLEMGGEPAAPIPVTPTDSGAGRPAAPATPAPTTPPRQPPPAPSTPPRSPTPARPSLPPTPSPTPPPTPPPAAVPSAAGQPAPDTATSLPLMAAVGAGLFGSGLTLLRRRR